MRPVSRATNVIQASRTANVLTEAQAAGIMWVYYCDNKLQLVSEVGAYRAAILAALMEGTAVEQVFAPYFKPVERSRPMRRAA